MPPKPTKVQSLLKLASQGPIRPRDLDAVGIPRAYLRRLIDRGNIERVAPGLYRHVDTQPTELASLAEMATRLPSATICLLSALQVHGLTTQSPRAVWIMIDGKARAPLATHVRLLVVRASGNALKHGVTTRRIGIDVAIEALREYLNKKMGSVDRLLEAAKALRVGSVMLPYIQALT
jgi:predicted transcriptional regulator of viral defense system